MPETVFPKRIFSPVDTVIVRQYQDEVSLFLSSIGNGHGCVLVYMFILFNFICM